MKDLTQKLWNEYCLLIDAIYAFQNYGDEDILNDATTDTKSMAALREELIKIGIKIELDE